MTDQSIADIEVWVQNLGPARLPVMRRTIQEMAALRRNIDSVNGHQISNIVMHDPMMTLRVLQYLQINRRRSQTADITTIEHAIMMLGMNRFFEYFSNLSPLEDLLKSHPDALAGAREVLSRARHAALFARDWAVYRRDVEHDEVTVAALLHELAELLLWCYAPREASRIKEMQQRDRSLRSSVAQHAVLGFSLVDLQQRLAEVWNLPELIRRLMDDDHASNPRVINVTLAAALARHCAHGWYDPALPDDYRGIQRFLRMGGDDVWRHVRRVALNAARDWEWYDIRPAAAWLPLLPAENPHARFYRR